jgi:hypothetical protein
MCSSPYLLNIISQLWGLGLARIVADLKFGHYMGHSRGCSGQTLDWLVWFPWRKKKIFDSCCLDPMDGARARKRKVLRLIAQTFANRIVPDVAGDGLYVVGFTQDVIVVAHFTKLLAVAPFEEIGGAALEFFHEPEEIGMEVQAVNEEVDVVGHRTISVEQKRVLGRHMMKNRYDLPSRGLVRKVAVPAVAADSNEIDLLS